MATAGNVHCSLTTAADHQASGIDPRRIAPCYGRSTVGSETIGDRGGHHRVGQFVERRDAEHLENGGEFAVDRAEMALGELGDSKNSLFS